MHLQTLTFAESTKRCYATHLRVYKRFCNITGCEPAPLSNVNLCRYIAFLGRTKKYSTVTQYLNIVRILHLELGFQNPLSDNFQSSNTLKGLKRKLGNLKIQKRPITPTQLLHIKSMLNFANLFDLCFWAACLACFFGLLRISNVCSGAHCITRRDFSVTKDGIVINITSSKTIQYADRIFQVVLPFMRSNPLCPTSAMIKFIGNAGPSLQTHELFSYRWQGNLTCLTQVNFRAKFKQCLPPDADSKLYNSHSLRRGGCSFLLSCGVPLEVIKAIGDWKSLAVFDYLHPDLGFKFRTLSGVLENATSGVP